jgi:hypothetical protein
MKTTSVRGASPAVKALAGIAVVAAGLAGCASRATTSTTSAAGAGVASTTQSDNPGPPTTTSPATTASPSAGSIATPTHLPTPNTPPSITGGVGTPPSAGAVVKYLSPQGVSMTADGKTLSTPIEWGGCESRPQFIAMSQDSTKVVVEVKTTTRSGAGIMCPDHIVEDVVTLTLNAPLGGRQLVDGVANVPIHVG